MQMLRERLTALLVALGLACVAILDAVFANKVFLVAGDSGYEILGQLKTPKDEGRAIAKRRSTERCPRLPLCRKLRTRRSRPILRNRGGKER